MLNFPFRFFFACAGSLGVYMYFFSLLSSQSIRFAWLLLGSVYVHLFYLGILLLSYLFDLAIYIFPFYSFTASNRCPILYPFIARFRSKLRYFSLYFVFIRRAYIW